jgi:hypothetical protein
MQLTLSFQKAAQFQPSWLTQQARRYTAPTRPPPLRRDAAGLPRPPFPCRDPDRPPPSTGSAAAAPLSVYWSVCEREIRKVYPPNLQESFDLISRMEKVESATDSPAQAPPSSASSLPKVSPSTV